MIMNRKTAVSIILAIFVLFAVVSFSGCIGNDDDLNNTTNETDTPDESDLKTDEPQATETKTPEATEMTDEEIYQYRTGKRVITSPTQLDEYSADMMIRIGFDRKFSKNERHEIAVREGETIRFRNADGKLNSRFLLHSPHDNFEDFLILPMYDCYMSFPEPGVYDVELLDGFEYQETGELKPFKTGKSVLVIYVIPKEN